MAFFEGGDDFGAAWGSVSGLVRGGELDVVGCEVGIGGRGGYFFALLRCGGGGALSRIVGSESDSERKGELSVANVAASLRWGMEMPSRHLEISRLGARALASLEATAHNNCAKEEKETSKVLTNTSQSYFSQSRATHRVVQISPVRWLLSPLSLQTIRDRHHRAPRNATQPDARVLHTFTSPRHPTMASKAQMDKQQRT